MTAEARRGAALTARAAVILLVAATAVSCASPSYSPADPAIVAAREDSLEEMDAVEAELAFSDRFVVIGTGLTDNCSSISNWPFGGGDGGYRCSLQWSAVLAAPDFAGRTDLVAAIENELIGMDLPFERGQLMEKYTLLPIEDRESTAISVVGRKGRIHFGVSTEPFEAGVWSPPTGRGNVTVEGDVFDLTGEDVEVTGATQIVELGVSTEYWSTDRS